MEIEIEKGEVRAKGKIEPLKILKLIEKKSKKKVELISPKVKPKEITTMDKKPKEIKDVSYSFFYHVQTIFFISLYINW